MDNGRTSQPLDRSPHYCVGRLVDCFGAYPFCRRHPLGNSSIDIAGVSRQGWFTDYKRRNAQCYRRFFSAQITELEITTGIVTGGLTRPIVSALVRDFVNFTTARQKRLDLL